MLVYIEKLKENKAAFSAKLADVAKRLDINPNWLMLVMFLESALNPKAVNAKTGASGLIQFMPIVAVKLGTTVEKLRLMSGVDQLEYVYRYFAPYRKYINSFTDLYLITFYPAALINKKPDSWDFPNLVYQFNSGLDRNKDGKVNLGEFKNFILSKVPGNFPTAELKKKALPELESVSPPSLA